MSEPGRRFTVDVSHEVVADLKGEAGRLAVSRLTEAVVHYHSDAIRDAVHSIILDREWAEPVIREEIARAVRSVVADMFHEHGGER
jgi:hypothetical protein